MSPPAIQLRRTPDCFCAALVGCRRYFTFLTSLDIHSADVAGISVFRASDQGLSAVQLQLKSQQPVTVEGTVDDDEVKAALLSVLKGGERFCPDIRLDAVECLARAQQRSRGS